MTSEPRSQSFDKLLFLLRNKKICHEDAANAIERLQEQLVTLRITHDAISLDNVRLASENRRLLTEVNMLRQREVSGPKKCTVGLSPATVGTPSSE